MGYINKEYPYNKDKSKPPAGHVSIKEYAEKKGIKVGHVYYNMRQGRVEFVKINGRHYIKLK